MGQNLLEAIDSRRLKLKGVRLKCADCGREVLLVPEHVPQSGNFEPCSQVRLVEIGEEDAKE